jgi:ribose 5-phosphate isomerase A
MDLRLKAAEKALEYVSDGMILGLGSGATAGCFIDLLGERLRDGGLRDVQGVPTSTASASRARSQGISLTTLSEHPRLDLVVDGADEVDPSLNLIKGLGRALLREKIIEIDARRFIVIVDESKLVPRLGSKGPVPLEVVPFEIQFHLQWLATLGCRAEQWFEEDGAPVVTDNGNFLARCWFPGGIPDAYALRRQLADRPGIIEHGLFLDMAHLVIVGGIEGVRILERDH